jgi:hypothetical protein
MFDSRKFAQNLKFSRKCWFSKCFRKNINENAHFYKHFRSLLLKWLIFGKTYAFQKILSCPFLRAMLRPFCHFALSKMTSPAGLSISTYLGCPVPDVLSWLSAKVVPSRFPCPSCPVLTVMFSPSCHPFPVLAVFNLISSLAILSRLSCPCYPIPTVLSQLSFPECSVPAALTQFPAPALLSPALLSPLPCPGCHVLAVLSCQSIQTNLSGLSCSSCHVLDVLSQLYCHGHSSPVLVVLSQLCCLLSCPCFHVLAFLSSLSCTGCTLPTILSSCPVPAVQLELCFSSGHVLAF